MAAPPERGRANEALVALIASALDVASNTVRVVAGHRGRAKILEIDGVSLQEVEVRLARKVRSSS